MIQFSNMNLLRKLRYALNFIGAREALIRGDYQLAERRVLDIFSMYGTSVPSSKIPINSNIMYGLVAWNQKEFGSVYLSCRVALDQIESAALSNDRHYKNDELKYLRAYCKNLIAFADSDGGQRSNIDFSDVDRLKKPDFDIDNIDDLIRRTFPIDDTTWW